MRTTRRRKGLRVAVFGNFSVDPATWPEDAVLPAAPRRGHGGGGKGGGMGEGRVELRHVATFDPSKRYSGTLILWRAFEGFYDRLSAVGATV